MGWWVVEELAACCSADSKAKKGKFMTQETRVNWGNTPLEAAGGGMRCERWHGGGLAVELTLCFLRDRQALHRSRQAGNAGKGASGHCLLLECSHLTHLCYWFLFLRLPSPPSSVFHSFLFLFLLFISLSLFSSDDFTHGHSFNYHLHGVDSQT